MICPADVWIFTGHVVSAIVCEKMWISVGIQMTNKDKVTEIKGGGGEVVIRNHYVFQSHYPHPENGDIQNPEIHTSAGIPRAHRWNSWKHFWNIKWQTVPMVSWTSQTQWRTQVHNQEQIQEKDMWKLAALWLADYYRQYHSSCLQLVHESLQIGQRSGNRLI